MRENWGAASESGTVRLPRHDTAQAPAGASESADPYERMVQRRAAFLRQQAAADEATEDDDRLWPRSKRAGQGLVESTDMGQPSKGKASTHDARRTRPSCARVHRGSNGDVAVDAARASVAPEQTASPVNPAPPAKSRAATPGRKRKTRGGYTFTREDAQKGGTRGGKARWDGVSKKARSEAARKAVLARWAKKKKR